MADAKKCDVCGGFYQNTLVDGPINIGIEIVTLWSATSYNKSRYDLCPECMNKINIMVKKEDSQ